MNEKALNTLEYNKIIDRLAGIAISQMGKAKCKELKPSSDIEEIKRWQQETAEAAECISRRGSLPLGGITDISESVKRTLMSGVLSIEELMNIGDFIYVVRKVVNYSKLEIKNFELVILNQEFENLNVPVTLEQEITRVIINNQEVADDASPALYQIRKDIRVTHDRIRDQLNSIIHSQTYRPMLQDFIITIRNDRYCVPVRSEYRGSFSGMVHDQSASGATVFIEPMSVIQLNNRIKELKAKEKAEIEKILRELSVLVAENHDPLLNDFEILTYLDFIFAKGSLALTMKAFEPRMNTEGRVNIIKGRHPLLDKDTVVPTDIYLGKEFTTLLITGPNTGGKTVALKTVGLFTLMGQAGLHISANEHSELAVFDEVFADIGDEQSIEQSLSTFSSHMSNIVKILDAVTDNSLVLLDELGAGTDPTEGAALAVSILQYLRDRQIRTAVTTHYSELKVYAISTEGVENASCEFDVETLRPTYKLLIGIPGKSNAFAISRRLGLPEFIINDAKNVLSHEDARFEDLITDLEVSKKTVILEQERAMQYRAEAETLKKSFEAEKEKLRVQKEKVMTKAREEARQVLMDAQIKADAMIKELQRQIKESSTKDIQAVRQQLKEGINQLDQSLAKEAKRAFEPLATVSRGDRVFVNTLNQSAIVVTTPDDNGELTVQAGIMKIKVQLSSLSKDTTEETITVSNRNLASASKIGKSLSISNELDLRGRMVEEALSETDKYLDDAYVSGLSTVTLIHGKGTGALRTAIQSHIKNHPHVKSYRLGKFGEGETGVTIVELK